MIQAIVEGLPVFTGQDRDDAEVGEIAVAKEQGSRVAGEFGKGLFEFAMGLVMSADEMGGAAAEAEVATGANEGLDDAFIRGQTKIVITAERQ